MTGAKRTQRHGGKQYGRREAEKPNREDDFHDKNNQYTSIVGRCANCFSYLGQHLNLIFFSLLAK